MKNDPLIVITGASSGIGAATARRFGREKCRLILLARRLDKLQEVQKEIEAPSSIYQLDVRDAEAVSTVMDQIGPIDVLVNNAGGAFGIEPAHQASLKDWDQCVDINIKGLLYTTRAVLPSMVKQNRGHIINIGSVAGTYPYPGGNIYGATKAFVHQFSLNLRADLFGTCVRVSCIEPGLTAGTEFSLVRFHGDKSRATSLYQQTQPLQAEDIAEIIYFCHALPPHVNINTLEVMPVSQSSAALAVNRD